jgi:hypothetical protein
MNSTVYALSVNEPWNRHGNTADDPHIYRIHNPQFWGSYSFLWRLLYDELLEMSIQILLLFLHRKTSCNHVYCKEMKTRWNVRWKLLGFWLHEICKHSSGGLIIGYVNMIGVSHFRVGQTFLSWKNTTDFKRRKRNRTPVFSFLALCLN